MLAGHPWYRAVPVALVMLAACGTDPLPLAGSWTARVMLLPGTGVPLLDSAAQTTLQLQIDQTRSGLAGTLSGLYASAASVSGARSGDSVALTFVGPGAAHATFSGHISGNSLPGVLRLASQDTVAHPLTFEHP